MGFDGLARRDRPGNHYPYGGRRHGVGGGRPRHQAAHPLGGHRRAGDESPPPPRRRQPGPALGRGGPAGAGWPGAGPASAGGRGEARDAEPRGGRGSHLPARSGGGRRPAPPPRSTPAAPGGRARAGTGGASPRPRAAPRRPRWPGCAHRRPTACAPAPAATRAAPRIRARRRQLGSSESPPTACRGRGCPRAVRPRWGRAPRSRPRRGRGCTNPRSPK